MWASTGCVVPPPPHITPRPSSGNDVRAARPASSPLPAISPPLYTALTEASSSNGSDDEVVWTKSLTEDDLDFGFHRTALDPSIRSTPTIRTGPHSAGPRSGRSDPYPDRISRGDEDDIVVIERGSGAGAAAVRLRHGRANCGMVVG
jgi:hypothetical protein